MNIDDISTSRYLTDWLGPGKDCGLVMDKKSLHKHIFIRNYTKKHCWRGRALQQQRNIFSTMHLQCWAHPNDICFIFNNLSVCVSVVKKWCHKLPPWYFRLHSFKINLWVFNINKYYGFVKMKVWSQYCFLNQ